MTQQRVLKKFISQSQMSCCKKDGFHFYRISCCVGVIYFFFFVVLLLSSSFRFRNRELFRSRFLFLCWKCHIKITFFLHRISLRGSLGDFVLCVQAKRTELAKHKVNFVVSYNNFLLLCEHKKYNKFLIISRYCFSLLVPFLLTTGINWT